MVQIHASATRHVSLDVTGASVYLTEGDPDRTSPDVQAERLAKALTEAR